MITATKANVEPARILAGGEWIEAVSGRTFATVNPATGEVLTTVADGDSGDIDRAVKSARQAFDDPKSKWRKMTSSERGRLLWKLADLMERDLDELAELETLDNGKPIFESKYVDMPMAIDVIRYFAGMATKLHGDTTNIRADAFTYSLREPIGVVGAIVPWNFPLLLATWKLGPALACGNTVVLKPAEQTPLTAVKLGKLSIEAGFPPGVLNIVTGGPAAGAALVRHPDVDKVAFTGSTPVGKEIMRSAADTLKRVTLELGGKSPNIVFADSDMESAVKGTLSGIFYGKGEVCSAGSRLFIESKVKDEFLDKLVDRTKKMKPGDPLDPRTRLGAIVSEQQMNTVLQYIEKGKAEGGRIIAGGSRVAVNGDKGFFIEPTVFSDVSNDMTIAQEEIFGPVLAAMTFEDLDEVATLANKNIYGLAAGIWTTNVKKAHALAQRLKAGTIWINTYGPMDAALPFGGFKQSGFGRELGIHAIDHYTEVKSVWMSL